MFWSDRLRDRWGGGLRLRRTDSAAFIVRGAGSGYCLSQQQATVAKSRLKVGGPRVLFGYHRGSGGLLSGEQGREQWQRLVLMMCTFQTERRTGIVAMTEGVSGLVWSGGGRVSTGKGQGEEEADPWAWPRGEGCPGRRSLITVEATRRWRDRKRGASSRFALGNR